LGKLGEIRTKILRTVKNLPALTPMLPCGHESWITTERVLSQVQAV